MPLLYNSKTEVYSGIYFLLIFALKHILWVLVKAVHASTTVYAMSQIENLTFFPTKSQNHHFYSCNFYIHIASIGLLTICLCKISDLLSGIGVSTSDCTGL